MRRRTWPQATCDSFSVMASRCQFDLSGMPGRLGVDLVDGGRKAFEEALASNHQVILSAYVKRQYDNAAPRPRVLAPPGLLDDDPEDKSEK